MAEEANSHGTVRSGILNAGKQRKSEKINLLGYDVEVRQPTVGQVLEMQQASDQTDMLLNMLVEQTYLPGTNTKVFDPADKKELRDLPADEWINEFNRAVMSLTSLNTEEAEKN